MTIKIVHTNDIHGRSAYQEESVVGFEKLAALIWNYGKDRLKELQNLSEAQKAA